MNAQTQLADAERSRLLAALASLNQVLLGKDREVRLALACLLARGHLLIEDIPGVGKTTLAHALARVLGLSYQRIQFTSDLLPADVIGISVYDRASGRFKFHRGPVFAQLVMADEVNRATPKAQSALLEAMEERQVTIDGETHALPEPFFIVATQNPSFQIGTFPLPESQVDRFLMRVELGYPAASHERALLRGPDRRDVLADLPAVLDPAAIPGLQRRVAEAPRAKAVVTRPGFRRAPSSPSCARRRPGPSCTATRACCPRTCRQCCRRSSGIGCGRATPRTAADRPRSRPNF
jgi:MoxR-like ATPase